MIIFILYNVKDQKNTYDFMNSINKIILRLNF